MKLNKLGRIALLVTALSLIAPVTANSANAAGRYITVNAVGVVKAVPDAVKVMAQVSVVGATNSAALASANTSSSAVRKAIFANGVVTKDLATTSISVSPEYNYTPDKGSVQIGFRASQSFTITVRSAANAGTIVDAIVAAGGDNLQLNGVSPFITDDAKATLAARSAAVANAKSKAASYAKLLGVKLGKVNYIVENSSSVPTPIYSVAKTDASTSIDLGTQDVSVSITVQWSII